MAAEAGRVKRKPNPKKPRQEPLLLTVQDRLKECPEVSLGFSPEQARLEAERCLNCQDPKCVQGCPLQINIAAFISCLADDDYQNAFRILSETNPFSGICGRVCQHELFCEKSCVLGLKLAPIAIGELERFTADYGDWRAVAENSKCKTDKDAPLIACVGSGPASLICAHDLARRGYRVTVFEALHELGGVLAYGIPIFRLPREVIHQEIERLKKMGVEFQTNVVVGRTVTLEELIAQGYQAVFIGTGAGLPKFLGIPGENLGGVYTANEFLTRLNLMRAYQPDSDTGIIVGRQTVVIGGGNAALDSARWARRLGSEATIVYRRTRREMPARTLEITHAREEGVNFEFLTTPVRIWGKEEMVSEVECLRTALGEPDKSGRAIFQPVAGSEFRLPAETVVLAIGQNPNPTLQRTTPSLRVTENGKILVDAEGQTNLSLVFAGGDVVRGGATVILAMRDGRKAAQSIQRILEKRRS